MKYTKKLIEYLKTENKFYLLLLCVSIVGALALSIYVPQVQAAFIDMANNTDMQTLPISHIAYTIFISIVSVVCISIASIIPSLLMLKYEIGEKLNLMSIVQFIKPTFLRNVGAEGLYYGFGNIANDLSFIAYPAIIHITLSILQAIVVVILLANISHLLIIPAILMWIIYMSLMLAFSHTQKKYIAKSRKIIPQMSDTLHSVIAESETLSRFGNILSYTSQFETILNDYNTVNEKAQRLTQMQSTLLTYIKGICFGVFVLVAMNELQNAHMTKGHLIMVLSYIPILMSPLSKIQYFIKIRAWMEESDNNKKELLDECHFPFKFSLQKLPSSTDINNLEVANVSFAYQDAQSEDEYDN